MANSWIAIVLMGLILAIGLVLSLRQGQQNEIARKAGIAAFCSAILVVILFFLVVVSARQEGLALLFAVLSIIVPLAVYLIVAYLFVKPPTEVAEDSPLAANVMAGETQKEAATESSSIDANVMAGGTQEEAAESSPIAEEVGVGEPLVIKHETSMAETAESEPKKDELAKDETKGQEAVLAEEVKPEATAGEPEKSSDSQEPEESETAEKIEKPADSQDPEVAEESEKPADSQEQEAAEEVEEIEESMGTQKQESAEGGVTANTASEISLEETPVPNTPQDEATANEPESVLGEESASTEYWFYDQALSFKERGHHAIAAQYFEKSALQAKLPEKKKRALTEAMAEHVRNNTLSEAVRIAHVLNEEFDGELDKATQLKISMVLRSQS